MKTRLMRLRRFLVSLARSNQGEPPTRATCEALEPRRLLSIGTPVFIGTNHAAAQGSSLTLHPNQSVAAGSTILVAFVMHDNKGGNNGTVSAGDNKSNTYARDLDVIPSSSVDGNRTVVLSAPVTTALGTGDTITITYPNVTSTDSAALSAFSVSGLVTASPPDQTHGTASSTASTSPSSGTASATLEANELLFGAVGVHAASTTFTAETNWTGLTAATNTNSKQASMYPEYRIVSATGSYAATGTISNSVQWAAGIVTYKAANSVSTSTSVALTTGANPSTYGSSLTFTATISNTETGGGLTPTGSVEFFDGTTDLGAGSALSGSGTTATSTLPATSLLNASTHSINAHYTANGSFISSNSSNLSQTVNKAALTLTAQNNTKTYDAGTSASATPSVSGLKNSDTVTSLTETYDTKNAGSGKTLSVATYTINDGNSGNNYTVSTVTNTTGVINTRALTVTAASNTKTYDGSTSAGAVPTITSGSLQGSDSANFSEAYSAKNAGSSLTLTPSGTVSDGNSGNNYAYTFTSANTGTITARSLTVSATGVNKTYDGTTAATVTLSDNRVSGDSLTDNYSSAVFSDQNVGTNKSVSVTGISISGTDAGNYSANTTASTTANIAPAAPTGLALTVAGNFFISFAWTASTGATGYNILRMAPGEDSYTQIATTTSTTFTDSPLDLGVTCSYEVQATAAGMTSAASSALSASTAPLAPGDLAVSGTTASSVSLAWGAYSGATAYHIERSTDGVNFIELDGNLSAPSYTDNTVFPGLSYVYRVRAERNGSFTGYSDTVSATIAPEAPANLVANYEPGGLVSLSWSSVVGATGYEIYRNPNSGTIFDAVGVSTVPSFTDSLPNPNGNYWYEVRAYNAAGSSPACQPLVPNRPPGNFVSGRWIFYNNSAFDGNDPSANSNDYAAIATDKTALVPLPGLGLILPSYGSTYQDISSYSKGINGIMVDIQRPGYFWPIDGSDFSFLVGNTSDPSTWIAAPAPSAVTVLNGGPGFGRIAITWPDGAIKNEWLQVTVKADQHTGLYWPDVFYFGSLVGSALGTVVNGQFAVTPNDVAAAANDPHSSSNPAPITDPCDFDRDGRVDATDQQIAQDGVQASPPLQLPYLIGVPGLPSLLSSAAGQITLSWPAPNDPNVVSYTVHRSDGQGNEQDFTGIHGLSFTDTTSVIGTSYTYWVTAIDYNGDASLPSSTMSVTPSAGTIQPVPDQMLVEGDTFTLSTTFSDPNPQSVHTVGVGWGDDSGLGGFPVNESGGNGNFSFSNQYTIGGLFTVNVTLSDQYGQVMATSLLVHAVPVAPTSFVATATSDSTVDFTWSSASLSTTAYQVQMESSPGQWSLLSQVPSWQLSYTATGFSASQSNTFRVIAVNDGGMSAPSNTASVTTLPAPTITWTAAGGGNWNDPNNWSTSAVPSASDVVLIDAAPGAIIDLGGNTFACRLLVSTNPLTLSNGGLSISSEFLFEDDLTFGNITITGTTIGSTSPTASINISGSATFDGVTLDANAIVNDGATLQVANGLVLNGTLSLDGQTPSVNTTLEFAAEDQTVSGNGQLLMEGNSGSDQVLADNAGADWTLTLGPGITVRGAGAFNSASGTGNVYVVNQGTIDADVAGETLNVDLVLRNQGTLVASAGTLMVILEPGANSGTMLVSGGTLELNGDGSLTPADLSTLTRTSGTVQLEGTLDLSGGTFALSPSTTGSLALEFGTITNGTLTATGGTVLVSDFGTLDALTLNADMTVTGNTDFTGTWNSAGSSTVSGQGWLTIESGSTWNNTGTITIQNNGTLWNYGTFNNQNILLVNSGGVLFNNSGSVWNNAGTVTVMGNNSFANTGDTWTNTGQINLYFTGWLEVDAMSAAIGTISLPSGLLSFRGDYSLADFNTVMQHVQYGGSATITLDYGTLDLQGGTLTMDPSTTGSIELRGDTVTNGTLAATGGADLEAETGTLDGVTLDADMHVINAPNTSADVTITGSCSNLGTINIFPGGILEVGAVPADPGVIDLAGGTLELTGNRTLADLNTLFSAVTRTSGTVVNSATVDLGGGTFTLDPATTGSLVLAGGAFNNGTVAATGGATLTIQLGAANLYNVTLDADVELDGGVLRLVGSTMNGSLTFSGDGVVGTEDTSGAVVPGADVWGAARALSGTEILLQWYGLLRQGMTPTSFTISRSTDGVSYQQIANAPASGIYVDEGLATSTTYYYRVDANYADGSHYTYQTVPTTTLAQDTSGWYKVSNVVNSTTGQPVTSSGDWTLNNGWVSAGSAAGALIQALNGLVTTSATVNDPADAEPSQGGYAVGDIPPQDDYEWTEVGPRGEPDNDGDEDHNPFVPQYNATVETLSSLTVSDSSNASDSATGTGASTPDLYITQDSTGHLKVDLTASFDPADVGAMVRWAVQRADRGWSDSGTFGNGTTIEGEGLPVTGGAGHEFTVTAWLDQNGDGTIDDGEAGITVRIHVSLRLAWTTSKFGDNLQAFWIPLSDPQATPIPDTSDSHDLGDPSATIDWGDGSDTDDGSKPHFYDEPGQYTVTITYDSDQGTTMTTFQAVMDGAAEADPTVVPQTAAGADLAWDAVDGASSYDIYRRLYGTGASFAYLGSTTGTDFADLTQSSAEGVVYDYQVVAQTAGGLFYLPIFAVAAPPLPNPTSTTPPPLVLARTGTATPADDSKAIYRATQNAKATAAANGEVFIAIRDVVITAVDTVTQVGNVQHVIHNVAPLAQAETLRNVKKDANGSLTSAGGYAAALQVLQALARDARVAVAGLGGGSYQVTLQDITLVTVQRDGDWGTLTIQRQGEPAVVIRFINPIQELNFSGPGGLNGNIDRIDNMDTIVEEKDGSDLLNAENFNPDGSMKMTEHQWAQSHIYSRTLKRLIDLQNATTTFKSTDLKRPYVGPDNLPTVGQIRAIKNVHFDIEGDWPELEAATNDAINDLRANLTLGALGYTFDVTFGYKPPAKAP